MLFASSKPATSISANVCKGSQQATLQAEGDKAKYLLTAREVEVVQTFLQGFSDEADNKGTVKVTISLSLRRYQ